jgi:hypothetical protein
MYHDAKEKESGERERERERETHMSKKLAKGWINELIYRKDEVYR